MLGFNFLIGEEDLGDAPAVGLENPPAATY